MSFMQRCGFKCGEFIVYHAHGVGQIFGIEEQEIAGTTLELLIINFKKNKMTLRIPTSRFANVRIRKLSDPSKIRQAQQVLSQRTHAGRGIWSSRAQEYETKINSGDLIAIAEVVRDLHRSAANSDQSYSERQLYQMALDRDDSDCGGKDPIAGLRHRDRPPAYCAVSIRRLRAVRAPSPF
jgi:CarD family transcriptional regulator